MQAVMTVLLSFICGLSVLAVIEYARHRLRTLRADRVYEAYLAKLDEAERRRGSSFEDEPTTTFGRRG